MFRAACNGRAIRSTPPLAEGSRDIELIEIALLVQLLVFSTNNHTLSTSTMIDVQVLKNSLTGEIKHGNGSSTNRRDSN